jgi:tRNA(Ile)-lysidine synthase
MQTSLQTRVFRTITRQRMFQPGAHVGVAVSGGADSVALLRILDELRDELGVGLAVLHFNHQLRGAESDDDEKFVAALATDKGIEFFSAREDVSAVARARGWNLEDAARRLRYAFFSSLVHRGAINHVAVAHTADDQAETVLARLIRGTGPAGLAAIYPIKGDVVRPLLRIRRTELRNFLQQIGQLWREDSSNRDTTRLRAQLRHEILPVLERQVQPGITMHLGRLAEMAREDEAFWSAFIAEQMTAVVRKYDSGTQTQSGRLGIRCADLLLPPMAALSAGRGQLTRDAANAVTRRLVRGIIADLRGDCRELTSHHVEQVLQLATECSSGCRTELPGVTVERSFDWLWFELCDERVSHRPAEALEVHQSPMPAHFSHLLELGPVGQLIRVSIPEINRRFCLKVIDWPAGERETNDGTRALDRDLLRPPLVLRNWRPGDAYRPYGRRSHRKLKHFLRASRIAVRDRAIWPVLTSRDQIVWARGMPVAADFATREATHTGVTVAEEEI